MDWLEKCSEWCVFAKATNILQQLADDAAAELERQRLEDEAWHRRNLQLAAEQDRQWRRMREEAAERQRRGEEFLTRAGFWMPGEPPTVMGMPVHFAEPPTNDRAEHNNGRPIRNEPPRYPMGLPEVRVNEQAVAALEAQGFNMMVRRVDLMPNHPQPIGYLQT